MSKQAFAKWLSAKLAERGITASQLAAFLEVDHVSVGNWLKAKHLPEPRNIIKIAEYFKVDPDQVLEVAGYRPRKTETFPEFHIYVSRKFEGNPRLQRALIAAFEAIVGGREEEEERIREARKRIRPGRQKQ
ncbi:MAG: helix-turn-helix domain-containing protein [Chloroflexi bacterium]|nr:helix-turn-helix domain-containing protein [Chloroflexota bacterium]